MKDCALERDIGKRCLHGQSNEEVRVSHFLATPRPAVINATLIDKAEINDGTTIRFVICFGKLARHWLLRIAQR